MDEIDGQSIGGHHLRRTIKPGRRIGAQDRPDIDGLTERIARVAKVSVDDKGRHQRAVVAVAHANRRGPVLGVIDPQPTVQRLMARNRHAIEQRHARLACWRFAKLDRPIGVLAVVDHGGNHLARCVKQAHPLSAQPAHVFAGRRLEQPCGRGATEYTVVVDLLQDRLPDKFATNSAQLSTKPVDDRSAAFLVAPQPQLGLERH